YSPSPFCARTVPCHRDCQTPPGDRPDKLPAYIPRCPFLYRTVPCFRMPPKRLQGLCRHPCPRYWSHHRERATKQLWTFLMSRIPGEYRHTFYWISFCYVIGVQFLLDSAI